MVKCRDYTQKPVQRTYRRLAMITPPSLSLCRREGLSLGGGHFRCPYLNAFLCFVAYSHALLCMYVCVFVCSLLRQAILDTQIYFLKEFTIYNLLCLRRGDFIYKATRTPTHISPHTRTHNEEQSKTPSPSQQRGGLFSGVVYSWKFTVTHMYNI